MRVRKYTAKSMQEALFKVKSDLGRDAVILHTRKFRQGSILGFFGQEMVEVTAAVERQAVGGWPVPASPSSENLSMTSFPSPTVLTSVPNRVEPLVAPPPEDERLNVLREELQEIKSMVHHVVREIQESEIAKYPRNLQDAYQVLSGIYQELLDGDVEETLAKEYMKGIIDQLDEAGLSNEDLLRTEMQGLVQSSLGDPQPIRFDVPGQRVVVFVGPTGVGKTTTLAKLAAKFALLEKKKVGLVTADTYRIAAVDQLKIYAEIMGLPLSVVFTPSELREAVASLADKDVVLVDTAGRSPRNPGQIAELSRYLDEIQEAERHLVLSATTKYGDLLDIYERFRLLAPDRLVFTKLDETTSYGVILNMVLKSKRPMSYITAGQNVPTDIEVPQAGKLARLIVGDRT